jgi:putative MFS transporter
VILIVYGAFFYSGGFSNLTPYTAEAYPVRVSARALGLGQAANGIGKIFGPLGLALIAGSGNIVSPNATAAAVQPAFLFLAGCTMVSAIAFTLFRVETHGRQISQTVKMESEDDAVASPRMTVRG